jgi:tight adherence protein C
VTAALLGCSWAGLVAVAAVRLRPVPARRLGPRPPRRPRAPIGLIVGRAVLRHLGRSDAPQLLAERVGLVVIAVGLLTPILPLAALPAAAMAWARPALRARRAVRARQAAIDASLPEVVDLLILASGAGHSVRQAVAAVAARADGLLAPVLQRAVAEADRGRRLAEALEDVPARAGESTRPLVGVLLASERYGAPIGPALERLSAEVRADARRRAEAAAGRVPVKLLFPLVVCILPAFGLLTVAPLVASAIRSLRL